jgi:hypothetical protein
MEAVLRMAQFAFVLLVDACCCGHTSTRTAVDRGRELEHDDIMKPTTDLCHCRHERNSCKPGSRPADDLLNTGPTGCARAFSTTSHHQRAIR